MTDSIKDIEQLTASCELKRVISILGQVAIRLSHIISLGDLYVDNDFKSSFNLAFPILSILKR